LDIENFCLLIVAYDKFDILFVMRGIDHTFLTPNKYKGTLPKIPKQERKLLYLQRFFAYCYRVLLPVSIGFLFLIYQNSSLAKIILQIGNPLNIKIESLYPILMEE
jgi:hypothetical protein